MDKTCNPSFTLVILLSFLNVYVSAQHFPKCAKVADFVDVSEAEPIDFLVYDLQCTDEDGDTLIYELYNGNTYTKFKVDQSGFVRLNKILNAHFVSKFKLRISVTEDTPSALRTDVVVGVFSLDVNDNSPKITSLPSAININETTPVGTKVASCVVKDIDAKHGGLPGQTRVAILDPGAGGVRRWAIDSKTCDIYLNYIPDFETDNNYQIGVVAWDLDPVRPRSVTQSVTINILDSNDNYPNCTGNYKLVTVQEDQALHTMIYNLTCTDTDSCNGGTVYYKLADSNTASVKNSFTILEVTGELQVKTSLDYETDTFHEVDVDAYDGGSPSLTTSVSIRVVVTDVDDNKPTWPTNPMVTKTMFSHSNKLLDQKHRTPPLIFAKRPPLVNSMYNLI